MKVDAFELKNKSSSGMNPPSIKKNTCNISHVDKKIAVASRVRDKSVKSIQNVSKFLVQEKYHQRASRMEELLEILRRNIACLILQDIAIIEEVLDAEQKLSDFNDILKKSRRPKSIAFCKVMEKRSVEYFDESPSADITGGFSLYRTVSETYLHVVTTTEFQWERNAKLRRKSRPRRKKSSFRKQFLSDSLQQYLLENESVIYENTLQHKIDDKTTEIVAINNKIKLVKENYKDKHFQTDNKDTYMSQIGSESDVPIISGDETKLVDHSGIKSTHQNDNSSAKALSSSEQVIENGESSTFHNIPSKQRTPVQRSKPLMKSQQRPPITTKQPKKSIKAKLEQLERNTAKPKDVELKSTIPNDVNSKTRKIKISDVSNATAKTVDSKDDQSTSKNSKPVKTNEVKSVIQTNDMNTTELSDKLSDKSPDVISSAIKLRRVKLDSVKSKNDISVVGHVKSDAAKSNDGKLNVDKSKNLNTSSIKSNNVKSKIVELNTVKKVDFKSKNLTKTKEQNLQVNGKFSKTENQTSATSKEKKSDNSSNIKQQNGSIISAKNPAPKYLASVQLKPVKKTTGDKPVVESNNHGVRPHNIITSVVNNKPRDTPTVKSKQALKSKNVETPETQQSIPSSSCVTELSIEEKSNITQLAIKPKNTDINHRVKESLDDEINAKSRNEAKTSSSIKKEENTKRLGVIKEEFHANKSAPNMPRVTTKNAPKVTTSPPLIPAEESTVKTNPIKSNFNNTKNNFERLFRQQNKSSIQTDSHTSEQANQTPLPLKKQQALAPKLKPNSDGLKCPVYGDELVNLKQSKKAEITHTKSNKNDPLVKSKSDDLNKKELLPTENNQTNKESLSLEKNHDNKSVLKKKESPRVKPKPKIVKHTALSESIFQKEKVSKIHIPGQRNKPENPMPRQSTGQQENQASVSTSKSPHTQQHSTKPKAANSEKTPNTKDLKGFQTTKDPPRHTLQIVNNENLDKAKTPSNRVVKHNTTLNNIVQTFEHPSTKSRKTFDINNNNSITNKTSNNANDAPKPQGNNKTTKGAKLGKEKAIKSTNNNDISTVTKTRKISNELSKKTEKFLKAANKR